MFFGKQQHLCEQHQAKIWFEINHNLRYQKEFSKSYI